MQRQVRYFGLADLDRNWHSRETTCSIKLVKLDPASLAHTSLADEIRDRRQLLIRSGLAAYD